jgi:hypothetical protein
MSYCLIYVFYALSLRCSACLHLVFACCIPTSYDILICNVYVALITKIRPCAGAFP